MKPIFKSLDPIYKDPVGAVEENTRVHFKIILPRNLHCSSASLVVVDDVFCNTEKFPTFWCGLVENNYEGWECHFIPRHKGLFFYKFEITTCLGKRQIIKTSLFDGTCSLDEVEKQLPMFQLTVYKKNFSTPNWMNGGIMYQIFPDRFFFSGKEKKNVPEDRLLKRNWFENPDFKPNKNNEVTNSDYFCGDLGGIIVKLDYLKALGITCLYINPVFEAHSNHRYNTADYSKIDPLLGRNQDFEELCKEAKRRGIKVIIDGVFNHTGDDSVYFNKKNRYSSIGAYNSKESRFFNWYNFTNWPESYSSWWGFITLPEVKEDNEDYQNYICGKDGIVSKWIKAGASGWRLDVADELPDDFIKKISKAAKESSDDAVILGEVWEDATTKKGFGKRRQYLLGEELDSVMNYPFRDAIIDFISGGNTKDVMEQILSILENYPREVIKNLMNILGTHDTERIITRLSGDPLESHDKEWQSQKSLSNKQRVKGVKLLKVASAMQYTLPGVPCIYYGDEVGLEGYKDPFCRRCYPWGMENKVLLDWYIALGNLRRNCSAFSNGDFNPIYVFKNVIVYERKDKNSSVLCVFNVSPQDVCIDLPQKYLFKKSLSGIRTKETSFSVPTESCEIIF